MTPIANFYVTRAHRSFLNVWGDDDNVVSVQIRDSTVWVTVKDLEGEIYPASIDGVPFEYSTQARVWDAA